jgi:hypothetical protein
MDDATQEVSREEQAAREVNARKKKASLYSQVQEVLAAGV